jgi:hypothetical protein
MDFPSRETAAIQLPVAGKLIEAAIVVAVVA